MRDRAMGCTPTGSTQAHPAQLHPAQPCPVRPNLTRSFPAEAGFTLIEMIVVIVIMAFIAGLVLVNRPTHSAGFDLDASIRALTSGLRMARSRAIAQDRDVTVVTDTAGFAVDGSVTWMLPTGQALTPSQVVFMPDGGSSGATIVLATRARRVAVSVNWLTGRVLTKELDQ